MSHTTIVTRWLACLLVMVLATACVQNIFDTRQGRVAITVKWPKKSDYAVLGIPEGTAMIRVSIIGEGIEGEPLSVPPLTPDDGAETATEFLDVPIGPKVVQAVAYDAAQREVASGQALITVRPNTINDARIVMQEDGTIIVKPGGEKPDPTATASVEPTAAPAYTIDTAAGDGTPGAFDASDPLVARFKYPGHLAVSSNPQDRALYIADTQYRLIRRYDLETRVVTTVAGQPPVGDVEPSPEASAAPALLGGGIGAPGGVAVDPMGQVYFTDRENHLIRKVRPGGGVITVAGTGKPGDKDHASPTQASFHYPVAIAFDRFGALYVADYLNHKIRRVSPTGTVTTIAGTGQPGHTGDGGVAVEAQIRYPVAIAVDPEGEHLYLAEGREPTIRRIRLSTNVIQTVAGNGRHTAFGVPGPAIAASIALPTALAFTPEGELLIAEGWSLRSGVDADLGLTSRLLKLTRAGRLELLAGRNNDAYGFTGDGGDARLAEFNNPMGLAVDGEGRIFVSDAYNNRIRVLTPVKATPAPAPSASPSPGPTPAPASPSPRL